MAIEIHTLPEHMPNDALRYVGKPVNRVEDPALVSGTVQFIDDIGTIHVAWDTGCSLGLVPGVDEWKILN